MTRGERPRAAGARAHASAWQLALQRPAQEPPREPFLLPSVVRQRREDRRPGGERGRVRGPAPSALAAAALPVAPSHWHGGSWGFHLLLREFSHTQTSG